MWNSPSRLLTAGAVVLLAALSLRCGARPEAPAAAAPAADLTPVLSVKELMEDIIDPQADWIFDAVAVDVTDKGLVETRPTSDEDWIKVRRGALMLAEGSNLLKMPRRVAPEGDAASPGGPGAPELSPAEIQQKLDADRALWNRHADQLRDTALAVLEIVKARDADKLFQAGSDIDRACENCHLDYWYPGDKAAVLRDQRSGTYQLPVQKPAEAK